MTVRARVIRDGPGEWSWTLADDRGEIVTGLSSSWGGALGDVTDELRLMAEDRDALRARAAEFDRQAIRGMQERAAREGRPWRKWLGL
jgi:hypothetical protein